MAERLGLAVELQPSPHPVGDVGQVRQGRRKVALQHVAGDLSRVVGADRVTSGGDVCNKIGTYLKALAAKANSVPFFAAVPSPTIDWTINDPLTEIPIEERSADEILFVRGMNEDNRSTRVAIAIDGVAVANPAFDVTPAELVSGIITETGVVPATREGLASLSTRRCVP